MNGVVLPDEVLKQAEARALQIDLPGNPDTALERLRAECVAFFDRVAEPPLYHRANDPARAAAVQLLAPGKELLARCLAMEKRGPIPGIARSLSEAVQAYLAALCHVADGRITLADEAWRRAIELERTLLSVRRLWVRSDEAPSPVFERASGRSRFDPSAEPKLTVKLACPAACQAAAEFSLSPRLATHRLVCARCGSPFLAYVAEARDIEVTSRASGRRYVFKVRELEGAQSRVEFDDPSGAEFNVARRDLLAFLYSAKRELRGVLNLSSGRLLRLEHSGPCFLATAVFGEGAPELAAFRGFRDEVLLQSEFGSRLTRIYYRAGPAWARWVARRPSAARWVKSVLGWVYRRLIESGYG
jgi:hypothetical protein